MVRLADFLKKRPDDQGKKPSAPETGPTPQAAQPAPPYAPPRPPAPVTPSPTPQPTAGPEGAKDPNVLLYEKLLACITRLFEQARANQPLDVSAAAALVQQFPHPKTIRWENVLRLVARHTEENYLYSHSVNVALLANYLGHAMGYPEAALHQLALAGLLIDIGMAGQAETLGAAPRKLGPEEWKVIVAHPEKAVALLKDAQALSRKAMEGIAAHHDHLKAGERSQRLREPTSVEFSKILAVCDVYDALTHPRSYRQRFSPAQAIKTLIDGADEEFDRTAVKALVDEITLYPPGSAVQLNTGETGVVDRTNPQAPLRPVVRVSRDGHGNRMQPPHLINLIEHPFVSIKAIVAEDDA